MSARYPQGDQLPPSPDSGATPLPVCDDTLGSNIRCEVYTMQEILRRAGAPAVIALCVLLGGCGKLGPDTFCLLRCSGDQSTAKLVNDVHFNFNQ